MAVKCIRFDVLVKTGRSGCNARRGDGHEILPHFAAPNPQTCLAIFNPQRDKTK